MIPSKFNLGGGSDVVFEGSTGDLQLDGGKFYPDKDDTDTYIYQDAADKLKIVVGNVTMLDIVEAGTDYVELPTAGVLQWASSSKISSATDGKVDITNAAGQGISLDLTTNSKLTVTDEADGALTLEANLLTSVTGTVGIALDRCATSAAMITPLPAAGDGTSLGLVDNIGQLMTLVSTAVNNNTATETVGVMVELPSWYKAGSTVKLRIRGKVGGALNATSTLDVSAYVLGDDDAISVDLCETAAIDVKAHTTYTNNDFTIDDDASGEALGAGDVLQFLITTALDDTGGSANQSYYINEMKLIIEA